MELSQATLEKNQLFEDLYNGKKPSRVPRFVSGDNAFCLEYAGYNLFKEQYDLEKNLDAIEVATKDFDSDITFGYVLRMLHMYKPLGATNFVQGGNGFVQHPDVHGLNDDEYDELIADPMKTIWDKVLPRIYTELAKDKFYASKATARAMFSFITGMQHVGHGCAEIAIRNHKSTYVLAKSACVVPYDLLADQLRSFTGVSMDIRRMPDKVESACEALLPMVIKSVTGMGESRYNRVFIPLHMGPYMRDKDFDRFYWPTFKKYIEALDENGIAANILLEHDYTRFVDHLQDLPKGQYLAVEYGDPKLFKDKLGSQHILGGFYPLQLLKSGSKEECVDKVKELMDVLAPGGGYIFSFDKSLLRLDDIKVENMHAVLDAVEKYGKY